MPALLAREWEVQVWPVEVTLTDEQILADYTIRKLQVQVRERKCFCVSISNIMNVVDKQISSCCAAKFRASTEGDAFPLHSLA